jgi:hypothetical protein
MTSRNDIRIGLALLCPAGPAKEAAMISRSDIRMALARGYCSGHNHAKPIDIDLIEAMADEVMVVISTAIQRGEFYRAVSAQKEGRGDRHPPAA